MGAGGGEQGHGDTDADDEQGGNGEHVGEAEVAQAGTEGALFATDADGDAGQGAFNESVGLSLGGLGRERVSDERAEGVGLLGAVAQGRGDAVDAAALGHVGVEGVLIGGGEGDVLRVFALGAEDAGEREVNKGGVVGRGARGRGRCEERKDGVKAPGAGVGRGRGWRIEAGVHHGVERVAVGVGKCEERE